MWRLLLAPAVITASVGGVLYFTRRGDKMVLYTTAFGDAANVALNTMPGDWYKAPFDSANQVLELIENHSGKLSRSVIIAHGGEDWFYSRSLTPSALGSVLGPRLASGGIVGLAGCSAGRSPAEQAAWAASAFGPGGANSYAAGLRDEIQAHGGPYLGEVRAHVLEGHTVANSSGRYFPFRQVGQPGIGVMPVGYGWQRWVDDFTGERAYLWITGQD